MRREARHDGLARIGQVGREGGQLVVVHPGVDEQHAGRALHDDGVALAELALVDQHTLRDLPQHGVPFRSWLAPLVATVVPGGADVWAQFPCPAAAADGLPEERREAVSDPAATVRGDDGRDRRGHPPTEKERS